MPIILNIIMLIATPILLFISLLDKKILFKKIPREHILEIKGINCFFYLMSTTFNILCGVDYLFTFLMGIISVSSLIDYIRYKDLFD